MKKILLIFLCTLVVTSAVGATIKYTAEKKNLMQDDSKFNGELFEKSSLEYNNNLALVCAELSEVAEDTNSDNIIAKYKSYGMDNAKAYEYTNGIKILGIEPSFEGGAFVIGSKEINIAGTTANILVITARGSTTAGEFIGDIFKGWEGQKTDLFLDRYDVYDNNFDFYTKIEGGLKSYLDNHPEIKNDDNLRVLITGHSLGGAVANMVGAAFTTQYISEKYDLTTVKQSNIYVYTFGAIKVLSSETNESSGFENIHNIFNYYDSFGEHGNRAGYHASAENYKFGHTEIYNSEYDDSLYEEENLVLFSCNNHLMSSYIKAIEAEQNKPGTVIKLSCSLQEEIEQSEEVEQTEATSVSDIYETASSEVATDFTIQGSWKSVGSYGFGQAQPGATVTFNETHCNFYSPYDTYQFYQENGKWRLACKNVLWQDIQYFTVTILDIDNIEIVYDGSNQKTVLQRIPY